MKQDGADLEIKVDKKGWGMAECNVDFDIKLPKNVNIDVAVGAGSINVDGIAGKLEFQGGAVEVTANGTFSEVAGKVGNGPVKLKGLTGDAEVKTGNGQMDLTFVGKPSKGTMELRAGNGGATVSFPKGSQVETDFQSGLGKLKDELGSTPGASYKVSARTGTGDLVIKSY